MQGIYGICNVHRIYYPCLFYYDADKNHWLILYGEEECNGYIVGKPYYWDKPGKGNPHWTYIGISLDMGD